MIDFLKRHTISFIALFLGVIIGLILYVKESPIDIWLIEYEYDIANTSNLEQFVTADTVLQYDGYFCRNYTSSIGDTLKAEGVRRHELKIYLPQDSKMTQQDLSDNIFSSQPVRITNRKYRETQKNRQQILYWALFGLFVGIVLEFILRLKKHPRSS